MGSASRIFCVQIKQGINKIKIKSIIMTTLESKSQKISPIFNVDKSATSLPDRFQDPTCQKGYGSGISKNLLFQTTNSQYGAKPPQFHDMPCKYVPRSQTFSNSIGKCGGPDLWRSKGLNTGYARPYVSGSVLETNKPNKNKLVRHE